MNLKWTLALPVLLGCCDLGNYTVGSAPADLTVAGPCTPLAKQDCDTGMLGICANGFQTCQSDRQWGNCASIVIPGQVAEACDGLDNNCDGHVDEGFVWKDPVISMDVSIGQSCCAGAGVCRRCNGTVACRVAGVPSCDATVIPPPNNSWHAAAQPPDGGTYDWNCDGKVDAILCRNCTEEPVAANDDRLSICRPFLDCSKLKTKADCEAVGGGFTTISDIDCNTCGFMSSFKILSCSWMGTSCTYTDVASLSGRVYCH